VSSVFGSSGVKVIFWSDGVSQAGSGVRSTLPPADFLAQ
jgi:hypothetical protein